MPQARKLRVVVVDDSEVVRMKLTQLLEAEEGFELVGQAPDGEQGLTLVQQQQPDVVIMDLRMPGISGIEATWQLGTVAPASRVLVLTVSAEQEDVTDAIMAGARGYVVKGADDSEIMAAVRGVAAGERVISPQVAGKLAERVRGDQAESRMTTPSPAAPAAPRVRAPAPAATGPAAAPAEKGPAAPARPAPAAPPARVATETTLADLFEPPLALRTIGVAVVAGVLIALVAGGDADTWLIGAIAALVAFVAINVGVVLGRSLD
jgi:DNA-binding NarL/FixJ family response regulator